MVEFPFKGLVYEEMPPSNDFNSRRILKQCTLFTDEQTKEISNAAFVMEFRLFLEHWKKYISDLQNINKHYGSIYEKLYSDVTHEAYDTCEEYVLAYCLRNYVVHAYD